MWTLFDTYESRPVMQADRWMIDEILALSDNQASDSQLINTEHGSIMYLFWILWGIDALVAFTLVFFFFVGLVDGTVSSDNSILWLVLLIGLAALLLGGYWLFTHQHTIVATMLMALLAVPGVLYGLFMLLMLSGDKSGWK